MRSEAPLQNAVSASRKMTRTSARSGAAEGAGKLTLDRVAGFLPRNRFETMIDKTYQPGDVEGRIYRAWEEAGAFRAGRPERAGAQAYSIVIPPPNVTG